MTRSYRFPRRAGTILRRIPLLAAGLLAVGVAAAACGSPSTTGPSAGGSTGAGSTGAGSRLLAYSSCMRSHGVPNFPDPASAGGIPKDAVISAMRAVSNAAAQAAQNSCAHLLPAGQSLSGQPVQTITAQQQRDYLKAAACMRSHGVLNFPEPSFQGGQVEFPMLSRLVDLNSPQVIRAYEFCRKGIPAGLPYSGSGG
jgi:hypothetical protein